LNIASPPPQYVVEQGDVDRNRDDVLAVWSGNLGHDERMAIKYTWFYQECPFGVPLLVLLKHLPTASLVGTASAGRRKMMVGGQACRAGVLVDLAVTPEHRSLGPALTLQQGLVDEASTRLDLLYGFPNPKAAAVFKRMGYENIGEMTRHAKVLRHEAYVRHRLPGWIAGPLAQLLDVVTGLIDGAKRLLRARTNFEWTSEADSRMDDLWRSSRKGEGLVGVRNAQRADWRFDRAMFPTTRYLMLTEAGHDGLVAWFALQAEGPTLHVRDYWCDGATDALPDRYVLALLAEARRGPYSSISVEICGTPDAVDGWKRNGFTARGARPVFGRWSRPGLAAGRSIFLTSADEDE
jgi:hypothetical protein